MNKMKRISALIGSGAIVLALAGPAAAGEVFAVVTGHQAHSSDANSPDYWGDNCFKLNAGEGDVPASSKTYVLTANYGKVIVKAGGNNLGEYANTIFGDSPSAGETVWADSNGNNVYDEGDKNISHIIFCDAAETTTSFSGSQSGSTSSVSTTTSFSGSQSGSTSSVTQCDCDTLDNTGSAQQSSAAWLLVAGLGVLFGSLIVTAPSRAKNRP